MEKEGRVEESYGQSSSSLKSPPRIIHKEITFYPSKSPSPPEKHRENLNDSFFELSSVFKQANTKKDRDSTCEEVSDQRYFKIHKKMPFGTKEDPFRQDSFNINPLNSVNSNLKNVIDNMGPMSSVVFKSKKESENITLGRSRVSSKTSSNKNQHTESLHDICEKEEHFKNDELNSSNHKTIGKIQTPILKPTTTLQIPDWYYQAKQDSQRSDFDNMHLKPRVSSLKSAKSSFTPQTPSIRKSTS
ncbi:unnamed protein product [Moneuplotes crassus]|uniref:Uncharacterized protein n=1 Tax=Euplotes crassus TaxID=5936 RepID=A0AAD1U9Q5_EUPCR|nr:unnamed protein product [Moneuplotes crassus]